MFIITETLCFSARYWTSCFSCCYCCCCYFTVTVVVLGWVRSIGSSESRIATIIYLLTKINKDTVIQQCYISWSSCLASSWIKICILQFEKLYLCCGFRICNGTQSFLHSDTAEKHRFISEKKLCSIFFQESLQI